MSRQLAKRTGTKYFFMFGAVISAIYFWLIIFRLVSTSKSENWLAPVIVFGVVFIFWALAILLENKRWKFLLFEVILIFTGLIFLQSIFFITVSILAVGILYLGTIWVHDSMEARVKLNIWMSLRLGRRLFVTAIALVVVGGFLMPVVLSGEKRSLPLVNITKKQVNLVGKVVSLFDSNLDENGLAEMTIDEYILSERKGASQQHKNIFRKKSVPRKFVEMEKKNALTEGRESISRLVARNVSGDEKIMNIFAEMINNKINNYFNTEVSQASGFAPLFFSALSFFAVFSIGSFLTSVLTFLVAGLFKLLVLTKLVKLGTKDVQVEVIE
jgi:hypothetical protein